MSSSVAVMTSCENQLLKSSKHVEVNKGRSVRCNRVTWGQRLSQARLELRYLLNDVLIYVLFEGFVTRGHQFKSESQLHRIYRTSSGMVQGFVGIQIMIIRSTETAIMLFMLFIFKGISNQLNLSFSS